MCWCVLIVRCVVFVSWMARARDFNSILNGIKPIRLNNYILLIFPIRFEAFFISLGILNWQTLSQICMCVLFFFLGSKRRDFSWHRYVTKSHKLYMYHRFVRSTWAIKIVICCFSLSIDVTSVDLVFVKYHNINWNPWALYFASVISKAFAWSYTAIIQIKIWLATEIMSIPWLPETDNSNWKLSRKLSVNFLPIPSDIIAWLLFSAILRGKRERERRIESAKSSMANVSSEKKCAC